MVSNEDLIDSFRDWYAVCRFPKAGCSRPFSPAYTQVCNECIQLVVIQSLNPENPRNYCYMIALTALYLYGYLLAFADEVPFMPDNRPGSHDHFTVLLVGRVCVGKQEDMGLG